MKIFLLSIFVFSLIACSYPYEPSDKMLALKKDMTADQAVQILQSMIWGTTESKGICGARGFWYDKESKMQVHQDKISMLAHERGRELKKASKGFDDITVFEKQYYKYDFEFKNLVNINIYDDPMLLPVFPECNMKNSNETYVIVDLFVDKKSNLKFIVYIDDFDTAMAALTIILPENKIILK